jgi:brefeldin A-resistance guanine nucleotide exchange factor 1
MLRWTSFQNAPSIERLRRQKDRKALLITGAQAFNTKPKKGVVQSTVAAQEDSQCFDIFCFVSIRLVSVYERVFTQIRQYISNPDNLDLLKAYIGLFDFKGVSRKTWRSVLTLMNRCNALRTPP